MKFDLKRYLDRIGLAEAPAADVAGLRLLHHRQYFSIPFENFDVQLGRGVSLDPAHLFAKLVNHRRGGYCFELNGLFLGALHQLGFEARPLLARVHLTGQPSSRTHQLSLVKINGELWVVDVGFGAGGPRQPLRLEDGYTIVSDYWAFRLKEAEPWGYLFQSREDGQWKDSYSFDLSQVIPADIALGNHYTSTSTQSHFVTSRVASRPTPKGRVSLSDFTLTEIIAGSKTTREVDPGKAYLQELTQTFGIELDVEYSALQDIPPSTT